MVKEIERLGIPAVQICTIIPIALTVGANRIVPGVAIPYVTGNPYIKPEEELELRKTLLRKALRALTSKIEVQTVFNDE
jgi:glycine reductase